MISKHSKNTLKLTKLIQNHSNVQKDFQSFEKFLVCEGITIEEKVNRFFCFLKLLTESDDFSLMTDNQIEDFIGLFVKIVEKHFQKLLDGLKGKPKKICFAIIKLIEIAEAILFEIESKVTSKKNINSKLEASIGLLINDYSQKDGKPFPSEWILIKKMMNVKDKFKINMNFGNFEEKFVERLKSARDALTWRKKSEILRRTNETINMLIEQYASDRKKFVECLINNRFDKNELGTTNSLVIGDDGGLFILFNSQKSASDEILLSEATSQEYLQDKKKPNSKIIIGQGGFGKVRLAVSVLKTEFAQEAQLVCVKKSLPINPTAKRSVTLLTITNSILEDYLSRKYSESIHSPLPIDMALIRNRLIDSKHHKGYIFMEIFPENTADRVFKKTEYQKWEYQKPFILEVLNNMIGLLESRIFNSDLKPQNILFDPLSRKVALIDLGSSFAIDIESDMNHFDASAGGFGFTKNYCPPEILKEIYDTDVNLHKAASYLCGKTIESIMNKTDLNDKE